MTPELREQFIKYEKRELTGEETLEFFQELIDTGYILTLPERYINTAADLILRGYLDFYGDIDETFEQYPVH